MGGFYTFEMTDDQVESIVIDELMLAYDLNAKGDCDEGGHPIPADTELLDAIDKVLKYFMRNDEYLEWKIDVEGHRRGE